MHLRSIVFISVIIVVVFVIGFFAQTQKNQEATSLEVSKVIDEKDLIGNWVSSLAEPNDPECTNTKTDEVCIPYDSEEYVFALENGVYHFSSYLHHRPSSSNCSWKLEKNTTIIDCDTYNELFTIISISDESLVIVRNGITSHFKRI